MQLTAKVFLEYPDLGPSEHILGKQHIPRVLDPFPVTRAPFKFEDRDTVIFLSPLTQQYRYLLQNQHSGTA